MNRAINILILSLILIVVYMSIEQFYYKDRVINSQSVTHKVITNSKIPVEPKNVVTSEYYRIAFINADNSMPLSQRLQEEFEWLLEQDKQKKDIHVSVDFFDSEGKIDTHLNQISTAFTSSQSHYDLIVVIPMNNDPTISNTIRNLHNSTDINVIILGREINLSKTDGIYLVVSDDYQAGKIQAEHAAKYLMTGAPLYYIHGNGEYSDTSQRFSGFSNTIKMLRSDLKVDVVADGGYNIEKTEKIVDQWIAENRNIGCIICGNDVITVGVVNSLRKNNRIGTIPVIGIDGHPDVLKGIIDGDIVMVANQKLYFEALAAYNISMELYAKRTPIFDYKIFFGIVTKENVLLYIDREKY